MQDLTQHNLNSQRSLQESEQTNCNLMTIAEHHVKRMASLTSEARQLVKKFNESPKNQTMSELNLAVNLSELENLNFKAYLDLET